MTRRQAVCLGGLAALSTAVLRLAGRLDLAWADAGDSAGQGGAAETSTDASSYLYAAFDNPFDGSGTCLWGFVDKTGAWVIDPQFETACQFSEGFALVQDSSGDIHFITPDGTDPFGALDCLTAT